MSDFDTIAAIGHRLSGFSARQLDLARALPLASRTLTLPALADVLTPAERAAQPGLADLIDAAHLLNGDRNALLSQQLGIISATLNTIGIAPVLIKGVCHLATGLWTSPGARMLTDIDLLVERAHFERAVAAVANLPGVTSEKPMEAWRHQSHAPRLINAAGPAAVEVHFEITHAQAHAVAPAADIIARARHITIGGAHARIPAPQDQVLIALIHGPIGSGFYYSPDVHLRDLVDIARLTERDGTEIDWAHLAQHLTVTGWGGLVGIQNDCLVRLTGMPAPFPQVRWQARLASARWHLQGRFPLARRVGWLVRDIRYHAHLYRTDEAARTWVNDKLARPATYARILQRTLGAKEHD